MRFVWQEKSVVVGGCALPERHVVCDISSLGDPGSRGFVVEGESGSVELFVVRRGELLAAYKNSCPHTGVNLEWQPDQFLDLSNSYIQCATHGALFRLEDGYCLRGPCAGELLETVEVRLEAGLVVVILEGEV
ncbi:MAG: Rieske 2Fe-2S domain-containing protein [gamma proteobacterium symbiont of Clathrolucina costata]